jgi:conjugal transfer pilus assembly protein TraV
MRSSFVYAVLAAGALGGCGSMSGLDAQSSFSCKAPAGVSCQSISGTYANAAQNNLPFQRQQDDPKKGEEPEGGGVEPWLAAERTANISPRNLQAPNSGMPIREPPLVLRVWIAPWEDDTGDLHDQSYFYTMVHPGKWLVEANRSAISQEFRPVYPLKQHNVEEEAPAGERPTVNPAPLGESTGQAPATAASRVSAGQNRN